jgi:uncharacterized protein (TIGR02145 family)
MKVIVLLMSVITIGILFLINGCSNQTSDKTVKIGDQIWMTENLNVDHYRNGDPIPEVEDPTEWKNLKSGAWCYYGNDSTNGKRYGKLYNWYAVNDPRGLAPEGWHIPTKEEFGALEATVNKDGNALKSKGQGSGIGTGTNTSGFSALLGGRRNGDGGFDYLDYGGNFLSSTERYADVAYNLGLRNFDSDIYLFDYFKELGINVRCVKD